MNEALIKELIKYKLNAANAIVNSMPPKAAEEIRSFSRIIMEGIEEGCKAMNEKNTLNSKKSNKLDKIDIE
ncbi:MULTISPECIES: hypothetical protein [Lutispora]|uniref:Uncharacterized protein n=2 Tax=root TaxID=1 RepID=A0ABT1NEJ1_9FIRM|nr:MULTISPECIES: hypothetical protein [Lutispora]MCQ1529039.1 hypothetical protein [Lutispora saccharofermentans]MEA4963077.1 hypothetical protein [Lutispora sp.]